LYRFGVADIGVVVGAFVAGGYLFTWLKIMNLLIAFLISNHRLLSLLG